MVYDIATFDAYFKAFKDQLGIADVVVGGYAELIKLQNSAVKYPVLVAELPDDSEEVATGKITWKTKLVILDKWGANKRTETYRADLNNCRNILRMLLETMRADTSNIFFNPDRFEIQLIERDQLISGDALFGAISENISFISNNPCP